MCAPAIRVTRQVAELQGLLRVMLLLEQYRFAANGLAGTAVALQKGQRVQLWETELARLRVRIGVPHPLQGTESIAALRLGWAGHLPPTNTAFITGFPRTAISSSTRGPQAECCSAPVGATELLCFAFPLGRLSRITVLL